MKTSLNQVREELAYIAQCHNQINSFFWGDFLRAFKENVLNYPLMCCYITPSVALNKVVSTVPINIVLCDKIFKDWNENLNDVESDMLDLCNQLYQIIRSAGRWQEMGVVVSANIPQKFISQGGDEVCGYQMTINFKFKNEVCYENLPLTGYDFGGGIIPTPPICEPAIFQNSDTTYEKTIQSGTTFVSEDINITLLDGSQTFPSNVDIDLSDYAPIEPALIKNSDDTFEISVNPGSETILPDIEVMLSDGDKNFPSNINIDLSNYSQIPLLPSGTYTPKNTVSGLFDLQWANQTANVITSTGKIDCNSSSAYQFGATFKVNHFGDFDLNFSCTNTMGAGICYFRDSPQNAAYFRIDHFIAFESGFMYVFGNGFTKSVTSASASDIFTISRRGNSIEYKQNGNVVFTETLDYILPFLFNCGMSNNGSISDIEIIIP